MSVIGVAAGGHCLDDHADTLAASGAAVVIHDLADLGAAVTALGAERGRG